MADQTTDQPLTVSEALAEPSVHVRRGWIASLGLASLGMWMASYTPLQVLLPLRADHRISPDWPDRRFRYRRQCCLR